jgi:replicative DNA helicase
VDKILNNIPEKFTFLHSKNTKRIIMTMQTKYDSSIPATKLPPYSAEAERAVLGAMFIDQEAVPQVIEALTPECFYNLANKKIFEVIVSMFERRIPVDVLTLSDELIKTGELETIGGRAYLLDINQDISTAANVEHHARLILEKFLKRSLIKTANSIITNCFDETNDIFEQIDKAESEIFDIAEKRISKRVTTLSKESKKVFENLAHLRETGGTGVTGLNTGIFQLDRMTAGFQNSDLIIMAARPSMGKTALALSIARNMAVEYDKPIAFFSLEMSASQLAQRLLAAEARVELSKVRSGFINHSEERKMVEAMNRLSNSKFYIDDSSILSVLEIRAKARRLKAEHNIQAVFVDYLQFVTAPKAESRQREISLISQQLKQLAKELEIPVIALAQLNRGVESRTEKRPLLSDLRESGSIEQDADVVMFIHRNDYYKHGEMGEGGDNKAEIIIGKQRNGPTGTVEAAFIKEYARFENLVHTDVPPEVAANIRNNSQNDFDDYNDDPSF